MLALGVMGADPPLGDVVAFGSPVAFAISMSVSAGRSGIRPFAEEFLGGGGTSAAKGSGSMTPAEGSDGNVGWGAEVSDGLEGGGIGVCVDVARCAATIAAVGVRGRGEARRGSMFGDDDGGTMDKERSLSASMDEREGR